MGITEQFVGLANTAMAFQAQDRLPEAIAAYRQALGLVPNHPIVLSNLGNVLRRAGAFKEALQCQRQAVAIDRHNGWFLANLALAERAAGTDWNATLKMLLEEPLAETETRMWAAPETRSSRAYFQLQARQTQHLHLRRFGGPLPPARTAGENREPGKAGRWFAASKWASAALCGGRRRLCSPVRA